MWASTRASPEDFPGKVKTFDLGPDSVGRVPLDPLPDWVLTRRRAIGLRIREYRRAARLSQVELGEHVGRDHKTIHKFEHAISVPTLVDLLLIADALDIPVTALLAPEE